MISLADLRRVLAKAAEPTPTLAELRRKRNKTRIIIHPVLRNTAAENEANDIVLRFAGGKKRSRKKYDPDATIY